MNCRKCGLLITPGNSRVIRRAGKRSLREHRTCPAAGADSQPQLEAARPGVSEPDASPMPSEPESKRSSEAPARLDKEGAVIPVSERQVTTPASSPDAIGGKDAGTAERGSRKPETLPAKAAIPRPSVRQESGYRFFLGLGWENKRRRLIETGRPVSVEIIPVPAYLLEADPELAAGMKEIRLEDDDG